MGLIKKIVNAGSNKNDVKIAKLELEKTKIENAAKTQKVNQEKLLDRKLEKTSMVESYFEYSKNNFDRIEKAVINLKNDVESKVAKVQNSKDSKLSIKEKMQLKKEINLCEEQLSYLYLSKDFLVFLSKFASGIDLNDEQSSLVIKFARYFDGVKVLDVEAYGEEEGDEEDENESLFGKFKKEIAKEFTEEFLNKKRSSNVSMTKKLANFYFSEYLDKYYSDEIKKHNIPEVLSMIDAFKKIAFVSKESKDEIVEKPEPVEQFNECVNCHTKVSVGVKFCPECGNKMEQPKPLVCTECGSPLKTENKFCTSCGHKVS